MKLRFLTPVAYITLTLIVGCSSESTEMSVKHISLLKLFQEPNKYQYQQVSVKGYLKLDNLARLYFHREDAFYHLTENAVLINLPTDALSKVRDNCDSQHSRVVGQFDEKFGITNVTSISVVDSNQVLSRECWSRNNQ